MEIERFISDLTPIRSIVPDDPIDPVHENDHWLCVHGSNGNHECLQFTVDDFKSLYNIIAEVFYSKAILRR